MNKDYHKYTAKQLLDDDFFIQSMIHPTPKTEKFWEEQKDDDQLLSEEINKACLFINNIREGFQQNRLTVAEKHSLWMHIQQKNKRKHNKIVLIYSLGAAAVITLLLILSPLIFKQTPAVDYKSMIAAVDSMQQSEIQLILSQEEKIVIPETNSAILYSTEGNVAINDKQVKRQEVKNVKKEQNTPKKKEALNQLIVPAGKRSFLTLSDGTKVWVNSGTHLIYPSTFAEDKREIYVDGEIYLEVSRNEHKPFFVKTGKFDVKVLGTVFNVSAYKEDERQMVVLVNGKVQVERENNKNILRPSEGFELDQTNNKAAVKHVSTDLYTAWVNGYYLFKQESVAEVAKRLSRYYDILIICDESIKNLKCSGKLNLTDDVKEVLKNLKKALPIKIKQENNIIKIMSNKKGSL